MMLATALRILDLGLDLRSPPAPPFDHTPHLTIVARCAGRRARTARLERSPSRTKIALEGGVARQTRRIGLQVALEVLHDLIFP